MSSIFNDINRIVNGNTEEQVSTHLMEEWESKASFEKTNLFESNRILRKEKPSKTDIARSMVVLSGVGTMTHVERDPMNAMMFSAQSFRTESHLKESWVVMGKLIEYAHKNYELDLKEAIGKYSDAQIDLMELSKTLTMPWRLTYSEPVEVEVTDYPIEQEVDIWRGETHSNTIAESLRQKRNAINEAKSGWRKEVRDGADVARMTKKEYQKLHKDYKQEKNGKPTVLAMGPKGTTIVPVEFIKENADMQETNRDMFYKVEELLYAIQIASNPSISEMKRGNYVTNEQKLNKVIQKHFDWSNQLGEVKKNAVSKNYITDNGDQIAITKQGMDFIRMREESAEVHGDSLTENANNDIMELGSFLIGGLSNTYKMNTKMSKPKNGIIVIDRQGKTYKVEIKEV